MSVIVTPVDPARFADPLAWNTEWQALRPGGANYRRLSLSQRNENLIRIAPTLTSRVVFYLMLLWGGSLLLLLSAIVLEEGFAALGIAEKVAMASGLLFVTIGLWLRRQLPSPHFFELSAGKCRLDGGAETLPLAGIHAVQLLEMEVRPNLVVGVNQRHFYSYELNLVLRNGTRRHLYNQADARMARLDAGKLAAALKVPLWDGAGNRA